MSFDREVEVFLGNHPDLEMIEVFLTDVNGVCRGKQLPADALKKVAKNSIYFPITIPFLTTNGTNPEAVVEEYCADPDRACHPVEGSLQLMPWATKKTAQVLISMKDTDGGPMFFDPRHVLDKILSYYRADELRPVIALEYEFFLFTAGSVPPVAISPVNGMVQANGANSYNMDTFYDYELLLQEINEACSSQGIDITGVISEYGDGQFEVNLNHTENVLQACDHAMMVKRAVRGVARKHGMLASFMAKPFTGDVGSGLHAHVSILNKDGKNIFGLPDGEQKLQDAIGGLLETMPDSTAFFAPNANSYRRFDPLSYAPIVPNWGENNRRLSVRIPMSDGENRRFEHRVSGADGCPHLVAASILAGAHYGMKNKIDPGKPLGEFDNVSHVNVLPSRWRIALDRLAASNVMRQYLGNDFVDLYLKVKGSEEEEFHRAVTSVDYEQYLRIL
ncbi:glutamine synthetase family protein [Kordiimonas pumila]|uniref:Glutamine synthetase family protein n=1 Tax=Kordiimonas pumila TaxID=2161677 RepID=A0ABV7D341_9PROT|nr:glutamine synthetase family protein [Kordiimonas pumila]